MSTTQKTVIIGGRPFPVYVTETNLKTENLAGNLYTEQVDQPGPNPTISTMQMPIFRRVAMIPG